MDLFHVLLPLLAFSVHAGSASESQDAAVGISNRLAADIHKTLSSGEENVFFSPLSISVALAMVYYGSRGTTAEEMSRALGYSDAGLSASDVPPTFQSLLETFSKDSAAEEYILYIANAILAQKKFPVLEEYKNGLKTLFNASAREVDFEEEGPKAVQEINDWVKQNTNGKIEKLLDEIDPSTVMVLLNAVYFKGTWKKQFDPKKTKEEVFYNKGLESEGTKVPTMYLKGELPYARLKNYRVIEIPYKGEDISMVILLPDARDGLASLEAELNPNTIIDARKLAQKLEMEVTIPKFKLEYEKELKEALQQLGIKNAFEPDADLAGISEERQLYVSKVLHKAVLEVNEEGSEAAAATSAVIILGSSLGSDENTFYVDHPFILAIVDKRNDLVLFQGRVNKL